MKVIRSKQKDRKEELSFRRDVELNRGPYSRRTLKFCFFSPYIQMALQFYFVNAFSSVPFRGNPATVVLVPKGFAALKTAAGKEHATTELFQRIASELSLTETVFVLPPQFHKTDFSLRFFTKIKEMAFCGHATLAAAHVLSTECGFVSSEIVFFTAASGVISVRRMQNETRAYELDLRPSPPTPVVDPQITDPLRDALRTVLFSLSTLQRQ